MKKETDPRAIDGHLLFTVFLLTTLVFISGLYLGGRLNDAKMQDIIGSNEQFRLHSLGIDIQNLLLQEDACLILDSQILDEELIELSEKLAHMESIYGPNHPSVLQSKEYFSLLQLRHWHLLKRSQTECGVHRDTILYFYSNLGDCNDCAQQGTVLTTLRRRNPQISVYHFDANINNPAIRTAKELFNITATPTLVFNGETLNGFQSYNALTAMLQ